jgi:hypothetical protein
MKTFSYLFFVILLGLLFNNDRLFAQQVDMDDIIEVELDYGIKDAKVQTHVYLNCALWNFEDQYLGKFANVGNDKFAGYPNFVAYSGYVSISGYINSKLYAEAEFELYQANSLKITRLRGVWSPSDNFRLTLGRDFPAVGLQDKVYYPTSQYRLFAVAPYLYYQVMRATGWWDAGVHLQGKIPLGEKMKIIANLSITNGPGDSHKTKPMENILKPNAEGYMFENFHEEGRQPWDNNANKAISGRLSFSPIENLEFGGSYMTSKYDAEDTYKMDFLFAHFLYGGKRLTIAAEYGQLMAQVPDTNLSVASFIDSEGNMFENKNNMDNVVTQSSWYFSAGYKFFLDSKIHYLEPVVRVEMMDSWVQDKENRGDRMAYWAGFRIAPFQHWVFKAAYLYQTETYKELKNDGFVIETVFDF